MNEINTWMLLYAALSCVIGAIVAGILYSWVKKRPQKNKRVSEVGALIANGANTFLRREYGALVKFAACAAVLILVFLPGPIWKGSPSDNIIMAVSYIVGTIFSAFAGKLGVTVATLANTRCAESASGGVRAPFMIGYRGGAVMGMAVVSASLLGVAAVYAVTGDATAILGFSFGASSLALFAKAGGGIFTKTADVAADLVGKNELGIPEDDPRNPAVIADNVGDNVGDVAGMGADLFDSNVASIAAALVMAAAIDREGGHCTATVFAYAASGVISSVLGVACARIGKKSTPTWALNASTYTTTAIFLALTAVLTAIFDFGWRIWGASASGLLAGVLIGIVTDYFTDDSKKPVRQTAKASESGPAFTILSGVSYGFLGTLPAMAGVGIAALVAYKICEPMGTGYAMFGVSMAALGMLSIVGTIVSNDAYGPIVDNARGIAEMCGLGDESVRVADELDSAGNTVKAITKGFAIGAAGLTVISLLSAFISEVNEAAEALGVAGIDMLAITDPTVFFGILAGAATPAVFSAMLMLGVDRNAQRMVAEIKRQFSTIIGLREGREGVKPDYARCITIATDGALGELIPAGLFAIAATAIVGFLGGVNAAGGFLAGNITSGLLLAVFMSNAGGLWDNAKKYIEAGAHGGRGSVAHKSAVVGDTVGDPFKDTAGPSINTQITVVSLVASLLAKLFLELAIF